MALDQIPQLLAKLATDRRQLIAVIATGAIWTLFEILGDPNPLDAHTTGALLLVVALVVHVGDWLRRRLFAS